MKIGFIMSNKMKKYFIFLMLLIIVNSLFAFAPDKKDFANNYQFQL